MPMKNSQNIRGCSSREKISGKDTIAVFRFSSCYQPEEEWSHAAWLWGAVTQSERLEEKVQHNLRKVLYKDALKWEYVFFMEPICHRMLGGLGFLVRARFASIISKMIFNAFWINEICFFSVGKVLINQINSVMWWNSYTRRHFSKDAFIYKQTLNIHFLK